MKEYTPKRRTALVFTGSGSAGAYHAGVLKAFDESGVKIDLIVGTGAGAVVAAFGAASGGARLYGPEGLWKGVDRSSFFRIRPALKTALGLLAVSFLVFLLPVPFALLLSLLLPLTFLLDPVLPGPLRALGSFSLGDSSPIRSVYLAALAAPVILLWVFSLLLILRLRTRRRLLEFLESPFDISRASEVLRQALWSVVRGPNPSEKPPSDQDLSRRYVALTTENLGQPGFREVIFRVSDLERGEALPLVLLKDGVRDAFLASRGNAVVDLRAPEYEDLLVDAVFTGFLPPFFAPVRRVSFPKGGLYAGEVHRLTDGTLVGGSGLFEALRAGAEQVILVSAVPSVSGLPARRRGPLAKADAAVASLERQALERDAEEASRLNRIVETLGHTQGDGRAWEDPATGRVFKAFSLYVVRPASRSVGPLEFDGVRDPGTEVLETPEDLVERGYRDAYRLFVEPVVGGVSETRSPQEPERQPVEL